MSWNPGSLLWKLSFIWGKTRTVVWERQHFRQLWGAPAKKVGARSVQFSHSVMSDSLRPHGLQHPRPPCPIPTPGAHPNSCPLSRCCHPTISSSVVPFSSWPQSFPASGSFQLSQLFASGGQNIGVSESPSVLPVNTQDWSPCSPRDSQESSQTPQFCQNLRFN